MVFEKNVTRVIVPLDPVEGMWYTEPAYEEEELDHIYRMMAQDEDQGDPTTGRVFDWEKNREYFSDPDEELESWQTWLHNFLALRCPQVARTLYFITLEVRDIPHFDESSTVQDFLRIVEARVPDRKSVV